MRFKMEIEYEIKYSKIKHVYIQIREGKVIVKAPRRVSKEEIQLLVENRKDWIEKNLKKEQKKLDKEALYAKEEFKQIVEKNANELIKETNLIPNQIRIRNIKYAWGSCSNKKNITINSNLINYSEEGIRYVILHELCHLKYMNHSKEFWNLVEKYMPDYKTVKKEFK